ncbi:MAG: MFS transporter [Thaumarchaeota archaeon]|jgi:predicted MFS family arabinose efflux permease|nr:MFS transporter [Candidatus Wolframiiraptor allenii]
MVAPSFIGLIAEVVPVASRAIVSASINLWTQVGSMVSTLSVGLASLVGLPGFRTGFLIAMVSGLLASVIMLGFKVPRGRHASPSQISVRSVIRHIVKDNVFLRFCMMNAGFGFFMSIAWPLFTITLAKVAGLSFFEISILTVASGTAGIVGLLLISNTVARMEPAKTLMVNRSSLTLLPIVYGLAPSFPFLLGINIVSGINSALINTAVLLFLVENTPMEERASFVAFYNLLAGSSYFAGSIVGGFLLELLESRMQQSAAMLIVYSISAIGRLGMGLAHYTLIGERGGRK